MKTIARSLGLSLLLAACAGPQAGGVAPALSGPGVYGSGAPDPAAVKCATLGGSAAQLLAARRQLGLCRVEQALIDDWTLFWATTSHQLGEAARAFLARRPALPSPAGDPAASCCAAAGGRLLPVDDEAGRRRGVCRFEDDSLIGADTLLRGPEQEGNRRLAALLR